MHIINQKFRDKGRVSVFVPAAQPRNPSCLAKPVKALRRTPCSQPELAPFPKAPIETCSHHSADCWSPRQVLSTIPAHYHRDQNGYKWYIREAVTSGHKRLTRGAVTDGDNNVRRLQMALNEWPQKGERLQYEYML
jgi:hypothetical protein